MLTQDRAIAEEVVQEAFARVWASKNTPSAEADFRRWLYRVITNLARDHHRRRRLQARIPFWSLPAPDPIDEVARRAEDRELLAALRSLALEDRQAIYLRYFEGQSFAGVADVSSVGGNDWTLRKRGRIWSKALSEDLHVIPVRHKTNLLTLRLFGHD